MENFIFLYVQKGVQKSMMIRLPIGTQITEEQWSGLFAGFDADLLRVVSFNQLTGGAR